MSPPPGSPRGAWRPRPPDWLHDYDRRAFSADLVAAVVVTIMLIPQSLAYALLAGLPAENGIYASILPAIAYALFGSSRVLAVGPVAVISLMTASALAGVTVEHDVSWVAAAALLALLSGVLLLTLGVLRMGWLANFLSHSVISGFISASAVIIALGQLRHLLGIDLHGETLLELLPRLLGTITDSHMLTALVGICALLFLAFARLWLGALLRRIGFTAMMAVLLVRSAPVFAVIGASVLVLLLGLDARGVAIVGAVPTGLPPLSLPGLDLALVQALLPAAVLISLVGFVESISVAQSLAMRRRQRVVPDRELLGLGAANLAAGVSGGFPVTGGFSRSVVNYDAGAVSPLAGLLTGLFMALVALLLTPIFEELPRAVLAAVIIVAVLPLVDFGAARRAWATSRSDAVALIVTALGVLLLGVEIGIALGVAIAVGTHLWRSGRPHMAIVGRVPGTEHFRNIERHEVQTVEHVLAIRVDESLYFVNARFLEDQVLDLVTERPAITDVVLVCSAVNGIDGSALETLQSINSRLSVAGVRFHLSEVKGPVMDVLARTPLPRELSGEIFFTQHEAMLKLGANDEPGRAPMSGSGDGI